MHETGRQPSAPTPGLGGWGGRGLSECRVCWLAAMMWASSYWRCLCRYGVAVLVKDQVEDYYHEHLPPPASRSAAGSNQTDRQTARGSNKPPAFRTRLATSANTYITHGVLEEAATALPLLC